MKYITQYETSYHGVPFKVSCNGNGWYRARTLGGLVGFATTAAGARRALEATLRGVALLGFEQPAQFMPVRRRRRGKA